MDIVAAIDLETTGLNEARCEVIDMAVVPLNEDFTVSTEIPEFTSRIKAEHPETAEEAALRVNGMNPSDGVPLDVVRRDFAAWLQDNGIRRIVPLAHNLGFDMKFLLKTFPETARVFSHRGRDSMRLALAVNDVYQRTAGVDVSRRIPCSRQGKPRHHGRGEPQRVRGCQGCGVGVQSPDKPHDIGVVRKSGRGYGGGAECSA